MTPLNRRSFLKGFGAAGAIGGTAIVGKNLIDQGPARAGNGSHHRHQDSAQSMDSMNPMVDSGPVNHHRTASTRPRS
jgi:TAT (twin-arginine translocation) pathway signal sequence